MENQKLRSKVAQLEVQIAEMKSKNQNGPYSGKCTYEIGVSNGGHTIGQNNGHGIGQRQSTMSSSMRISSTSMRSKPKLSKVESRSGCQNFKNSKFFQHLTVTLRSVLIPTLREGTGVP